MDISVIIPMFNSESTIIRTLTSVINQTVNKVDYEIIVVNDGSTDKSLKLVNNFAAKHSSSIIKIIDKENGGVSSARNVGLKAARGKWIALLDSDDEWLPDKIERQLDFINRHPNAAFVGTNLVGRLPRVGFKIVDCPTKLKVKDTLITMTPQTSTVLFKRMILDTIGLYNENLTHGEDGDLWLRIISNYESWFLPDELVIFDNGKKGFGGNGLSGNLTKMQNGIRHLNKVALRNSQINWMEYILISFYNEIKYIRRKLINAIS